MSCGPRETFIGPKPKRLVLFPFSTFFPGTNLMMLILRLNGMGIAGGQRLC